MKCGDCKVDLISTDMIAETGEGYLHSRLLIPNELLNEELKELGKLEAELIWSEYNSSRSRYMEQLDRGLWDGRPEYLDLINQIKDIHVDIIAKVCPKCGKVKIVADLMSRKKIFTSLEKMVKTLVMKRKKLNKAEEFEKKEKAKKDREIAKLKKQIEKLGGDS